MKTNRLAAVLAAIAGTAGMFFSLTVNALAQSDSVVAALAEAQGLPLVQPAELPFFGTFWTVQSFIPCIMPPMPYPPFDSSLPVYAIGAGQFLVDQTGGKLISKTNERYTPSSADYSSLLEQQVKEILNLIAQVQKAELRRYRQMSTDEDGGTSPQFNALVYTTNDLWLEIIGKTNATGYFVLHPPTAEATTGVYDLFGTTNLNWSGPGLNATNWMWVLRTTPSQTDVTVSNLTAEQAYFLAARTNDLDGDGMTDAYERLVKHSNPTIPDSPIRPGFNQYTLAANDDGSTGLVPIGFPISIFGGSQTQLYINNNGNISFDASLSAYLTTPLLNLGTKIIAPYWADVDTQGPGSALVSYGNSVVEGHNAFGANWINVGYYSAHTDRRLSCQLVIIDRSDIALGDFDMEFNYSRVEWEWGDASNGYPPRVGYSDGIESYELSGSGVSGAFLDSNHVTGLKYHTLNSWQHGQYIFYFRSGVSLVLPPVDIDPPGSTTLPVTVNLSVSNHPNATIYYTLDGSLPNDSSLVYTGSLNFTTSTTLKTFASEPGWTDSQVSSAYFMPPVPLIILTQPQSQTVALHSDATFSVVATGADPLTYQWIHNGNVVGNQAFLVLHDVQAADGGDYYVVITDIYSNAVSSYHVTLTVNSISTPPSVTIASPASGTNVSGVITVTAIGVDDVRTVRAKLFVDSEEIAAQMYDSPYNFILDTTILSNGTHQLIAKTYDIDNSAGTSSAVTITVDNFISNCKASARAFTPNGATNTTVTFSANFEATANWTLTITKADETSQTNFSGNGSQLSFNWNGEGTSGTGEYLWQLEATAASSNPSSAGSSGGNQNQPTPMFIDAGAPSWENVNNINYHAYCAQIYQYNWVHVLRIYFYTYLGAGPWLFPLPPEIFTYQIRTWATLMGYNGDIVTRFSAAEGGDLSDYVRSDHVVYMLGHGGGVADQAITTMFDGPDDDAEGFGGGSVRRWTRNSGNAYGFMFVQMNGCHSATYIDAQGNNDMAEGFGIMTNPLTDRRAYLGWDGYIIPGPGTLYTFDATFWNNLYDGWTVADAAADAFSNVPGVLAHPVIIGDPQLILPQTF